MILVAGATGMLGSEITLRLLQRGDDIRVLVRHHSPSEAHFRQSSADTINTLIEAGAQPVYGDLKDRPSLVAACRDVHQLITTANSASRDGEDNPQTVDLQGNRDLIDAALQAGVQQYIFVSALLGEPFLEHPFMVAKQETESYLRASGLTYTILAPNAFIEGALIKTIGDQALAGGPVALIGSGEQSHSFIARSDVVSFAIAALDHPAAINSRLVLGGPKPLTLRGVVAEFRHLLERDIPIQIYQPGEPIPELDEFQVFILASYDAFESPIDMSGLCRTFDIQLRPMQVVIREVLAKN